MEVVRFRVLHLRSFAFETDVPSVTRFFDFLEGRLVVVNYSCQVFLDQESKGLIRYHVGKEAAHDPVVQALLHF